MANTRGFFYATPGGLGGSYGQPSVGYGDAPAVNQENSWSTIQNKYPSIYNPSRAGWGAPSSAWGPLPGGPAGSGNAAAPAGGTTPGFATLRSDKSPAGNAALDAALGRISSLSNNPNQPVFTTTKDPALQGRIDAAGQTLDSGNAAATNTLKDFTTKFLAGDPEAHKYQQEESNAISGWYAPASDPNSVTASLDKLTSQRRQAVQAALSRAMDRATRTGNINRLGMGGDSSYANAQFQDTAGGLMANEAATEADLNRTNFLNVANTRNALAGRRAGLLNDYLTRSLVPIQAGQTLQASQLANLGALSGIQNSNRIYQTPEQIQANRLGLLGQYGANLNALNTYGVSGQFGSPSFPPLTRAGFAPPNVGGGGGFDSGYSGGGMTGPAPTIDPVVSRQYFQMTGRYPQQDSPDQRNAMLAWLQAHPTDPALGFPDNSQYVTPGNAGFSDRSMAGIPDAITTDLPAGYFPQPPEYYGG